MPIDSSVADWMGLSVNLCHLILRVLPPVVASVWHAKERIAGHPLHLSLLGEVRWDIQGGLSLDMRRSVRSVGGALIATVATTMGAV